MKYIIYPTLRLLLILLITITYSFGQIIHILWCLKPSEHLLGLIIGDRFYCKSHRSSFHTTYFERDRMYKLGIVPKSLFQFILWEIKYYNNHEIIEITKKENELYKEFFAKNYKP